MKEDIEFYINENGIACVPLKLYNDSLEEIERLNNIINELEKWLKAHLDEEFYWFKMYDKLNELKGDSSNE